MTTHVDRGLDLLYEEFVNKAYHDTDIQYMYIIAKLNNSNSTLDYEEQHVAMSMFCPKPIVEFVQVFLQAFSNSVSRISRHVYTI